MSNSPCALDPAQVDEEVEWLWAAVLHLRDSGIDVRYMAINNEPDLCPPGYKIEIADMVTIIKRLGARLRQEGLTTQIVVSDGWIPQNAFLYMQAALSDPEARQYVGALAYHSYDAYDNLDVLRHAAEGIPPHDAAEIRRQIRNLAAQYHLPVWMTEVCYCAPRDGMSYFDLAVGRLNHLFDELTITNVSAFDVMNTAFIERPNVGDELVHYYFRSDGTLERSEISVYGRLVGHFSRFVPVGSVRIEASSSNPVVRVVPFARPDGQWVVILLNNTKEAVDVQLKFHQTVSTRFAVLTSQTDSLWQSGPGVSSTDLIHMQPRSIMTLSSQP